MIGIATMILRGYNYEQVRTVAQVLEGSKVTSMEITLNTDDAIEIIRKISKEFKGKISVGAGTVLNFHELVQAIDAGATFVLSPNMMTLEMLQYCKKKGIISVSGAFTPTEINTCFQNGTDYVKVFPAKNLGPTYAKSACEPLGKLQLMAVGGITKDNVQEYLGGGYTCVGTAGGIFQKEDIIAMDVEKMKTSLATFTAQLI